MTEFKPIKLPPCSDCKTEHGLMDEEGCKKEIMKQRDDLKTCIDAVQESRDDFQRRALEAEKYVDTAYSNDELREAFKNLKAENDHLVAHERQILIINRNMREERNDWKRKAQNAMAANAALGSSGMERDGVMSDIIKERDELRRQVEGKPTFTCGKCGCLSFTDFLVKPTSPLCSCCYVYSKEK